MHVLPPFPSALDVIALELRGVSDVRLILAVLAVLVLELLLAVLAEWSLRPTRTP